MMSLLRSNAKRMIKDKRYWIVCAGYLVYLVMLLSTMFISQSKGQDMTTDVLFISALGMGGMPLLPILIAVFSCVFIGKDYLYGTIRNKLIIGKSRTSVYLSNFITVGISAMAMYLGFLLINCIIGLPAFGLCKLPINDLMWALVDGLFIVWVYSAIFTFVTMVSKNMTTSIILSLLGVFAMYGFSAYLIRVMHTPDMIPVYEIINGVEVEQMVANPHAVSQGVKDFCQVMIDILPSGQISTITNFREVFNEWQILLASVVEIVLINLGGILIFRKLDLK